MLDIDICYIDKNLYCKIYKDSVMSVCLEEIKKSFYVKYCYEDLIIDLTECTYIDSTSIGKLISLNRKVEELDRKMIVICQKRVLEVVTTLSLHNLLTIKEYNEVSL